VLVTKLPSAQAEPLAAIARRVAELAGDTPVLGSRMRIGRVRTPDGWRSPPVLDRQRVLAFAGLGRPGAFAELLESGGARVVGRRWFGDHHRYTDHETASLLAAAREHDATPITTGKDAVKLPPDCPVWVVEVEVVPVDGTWDELWRLLPGGGP
jgi:tetraacyldisaccharide 4'-kinase